MDQTLQPGCDKGAIRCGPGGDGEKRSGLPSLGRLVQAIAWAVEARIDVINLSLGIAQSDGLSQLEDVCRWALDKGSVLVVAAEKGGRAIYPGVLPGVISVRADGDCRWGEYLCDEEHPWQVAACPYPLRLPGVPPEADFHGSSIATSHVSGLVCRLIQRTGARGAIAVVRRLVRILDLPREAGERGF